MIAYLAQNQPPAKRATLFSALFCEEFVPTNTVQLVYGKTQCARLHA